MPVRIQHQNKTFKMLREAGLSKVLVYFGGVASYVPYCFVQYVQKGNIGETNQEVWKVFFGENILKFIGIHDNRLPG